MDDLEQIVRYIYRDSPSYAVSFYDTVIDKAKTLKEMSKRGRVVPELGDEHIQEISVHKYRMIYQISETRVEIITFTHGARELNNYFEISPR
ncbi:hypothetical protein BHU72_01690 [Desulfuribacillus stibiiarsenatis]|uniref:Plasmid stabilization protein n=2 Tax=Desulfuribacillus stibiiarsenatis TaxID=1390249 RepID=A0A1E5LAA1_9FIRM|nr:hypothetical protein BHU72_01690 [Desulfuribacillus stibiiarsenatis]